MNVIKKALKNKVIHFVFYGYATYFIQFINSLLIAVYLGPFYLGIWGFINLVIHYFNQMNFGISHSINAIVSVNKQKERYVSKLVGTALSMLLVLSILVAVLFFINDQFNLKIGEKYYFSKFAPLVFIIAILGYFNFLFSNIFRIYGKLFAIAFSASAFPILTLLLIFIFKGEDLLWALIIANAITMILSFLLFVIKSPIKIRLSFNAILAKMIQRKGWHLFLYNTFFYLIIISTRSFVSAYYNISEFGYFTFAFTLANAITLLLESFSYLIYPKMLNRFALSSNEVAYSLFGQVRDTYMTTSHTLAHFAILIFPIFLLLFPQYKSASNAFNLIVLTIVLYTNAFGYSALMIARNEEKKLGLIAFMALCLNIMTALLLVEIFYVSYIYVIISTMLAYMVYIFTLGFFARKKMFLKIDFVSVSKDVFPVRLFLPFIVSFILVVILAKAPYYLIPLALFIILNFKTYINIVDVAKKVINNPESISI